MSDVSLFTRVLVYLVFFVFCALALFMLARGEPKAAAGAALFAALVSPALFEAWRPRQYVLRAPQDGSADTPLNRVRQFRRDHPGWDGTVLIGMCIVLLAALVVSALRTV